MSFKLKILGSSSATPVFNRHQTSQLLEVDNEYFLIDCGEGTQIQLNKYRVKINKINYIFISHLHGDHYLGLVGLISTMHLFGRTKELYIYGPPGLSEIITVQLRYSETVLNYRVIFQELETEENQVILSHPRVTVETIPLIHRIKCCGFLFRETKKNRKIRKEMLPENTPLLAVAALKRGEDVYDEHGKVIYSTEELTLPPRKSVSYAFMSDTAYSEKNLELVKKVDVLYHEATFLSDMKERAVETYHTTAHDAAVFAQKAEVIKLIIGHFSSRYRELQPLLDEARHVFDNTWLAIEGETFNIYDED